MPEIIFKARRNGKTILPVQSNLADGRSGIQNPEEIPVNLVMQFHRILYRMFAQQRFAHIFIKE